MRMVELREDSPFLLETAPKVDATSPAQITSLLAAWRDGDQRAWRELMAAVYDALRRLAGACLRDEGYRGLSNPTVLVNELYLNALFARAGGLRESLALLSISPLVRCGT